MASGAWFLIRAQHIKTAFILMHRRNHALNQLFKRLVIFLRATDDLVVNISDIAHISDVIATVTQPARYHIKSYHHPRMANMTVVIYGHAADIHTYMIAI